MHPQPPDDESSQEKKTSTADISTSSSTNSESVQRQNEAILVKQSVDDTESHKNEEKNIKIEPKEAEEGITYIYHYIGDTVFYLIQRMI